MKKSTLLLSIIFAGIAIAIISRHTPFGATAATKAAVRYDFPIVFSADPPKEMALNATQEEMAAFAWNEFLALNWKSAYVHSGKRGTPDYNWDYSVRTPNNYPDEPVVWETYAHRAELRPYSDRMQPFDSRPYYSYQLTPLPYQGADPTLFNNLDENNEIGSCDLFARVNNFGTKHKVLYQAKTNREEYDYLFNNYPTNARLVEATANTRRNLHMKDTSYYEGANGNTCGCPPAQKVLCLPCGGTPFGTRDTLTGAIEVKTAWRELTSRDDPYKFFLRRVIVYGKVGGFLRTMNKTYALIGIHIIHKTRNYPNFIFATFEHVDVEEDNMGYVTLDGSNGPTPKQYSRAHPIPAVIDSSTAYVHRELARRGAPNSIWKYYRLVGVQGNPTNDENSFNFFLANYVIESDPPLSNFRGSGIDSPYNGGINSIYKGHGYSMGGCQGCHGAGQFKLGTDCSFLMDTFGKPAKAPDPGLEGSKLQMYQKAFKNMETIEGASLKQ